MVRITAIVIMLLFWAAPVVIAGEPPLPMGLGSDEKNPEEPALPAGLGGASSSSESLPALPSGLSDEPALPGGLTEEPKLPVFADDAKKAEGVPDEETEPLFGIDWTGFWEMRVGGRLQEDDHEKDFSIGETRLQLDAQKIFKGFTVKVVSDFIFDPVLNEYDIDLERGAGWIDLRQANVAFSPLRFMDLKVGRQILTWGVGDLVFLNDLFPKDWQAFFIGRDLEYLKAPSDAVKASFFGSMANLDIVFAPRFDPDRFITGERISFYNFPLGRRSGRDAVLRTDVPDNWFEDFELSGRLSKTVAGYEFAAYGYGGYWKSPGGFDSVTGDAVFPPLRVYGASVRGPVGPGLGSFEFAYYDSVRDRNGDDPLVNNSEARFLLGYEQDLSFVSRDLSLGLQYYVEWMMDHDAFVRNQPPGFPVADEFRSVLTLRVTKMLMNQNLTLSLFAFYCPSDQDAYIRPKASYKIDDHWTAEIGGNIFVADEDHTFFGRFEKNSNVYAEIRFGF